MNPSAWPPFQSLPWFKEYPLRMVVCCVLTARTKGRDSRVVARELMTEFPTAADLAGADVGRVRGIVGRLGFGEVRSRTLVALARRWLRFFEGRWEGRTGFHVWGLLPGCGKYAKDSWDLFLRDDHTVEPSDGVLNLWLQKLRRKTDEEIRSGDSGDS